MSKEIETQEITEVALTYTEGVLNWKTPEGHVIEGLAKEHFLPNKGVGMSADTRQSAIRAFYAYQIFRKEERVAHFKKLLESAEKGLNEYKTKLANLGKELTPAEKLKQKRERLLAQLAAIESEAEEMEIVLE